MADQSWETDIPQPSSPAARQEPADQDRLDARKVNTLQPRQEDLAEVEPGQKGSLSEADRAEPVEQ